MSSDYRPDLRSLEIAAQPSLERAVELVDARYDFSRHPYFVWMDEARTSRDAFRRSQLDFRFAVEAFSQSLAAVLARVPRLEERLALAENVAEEHGHGKIAAAHRSTFLEYLRAMGATDEELATPCPVAVHAFNHSLLGFTLSQSFESGAALLGMIEHLYVTISANIARTIHARGWVAPGSQRHYEVHATLDVAHARELFELAAGGFGEPRLRSQIALGLLLGAHYFWVLFAQLPR